MKKYKAPAYIAKLQLDKLQANTDWQGVENPLTVYDRIDHTKEKYSYPDLYTHFDKISENGKHSLAAALFEWIVNRVIPHCDKPEMQQEYINIIEGYWAASIDSRYGGCNVPDLDYELVINRSQRDIPDRNWVPSRWSAIGNIENILHTAIALTANVDDVINGPNQWLERLYYLALYLMPDNLKPAFQQWFTTALERLEEYTPTLLTTGKYEDIFEEHWAESRGLPVPPQLLDPEFKYQPAKNTKLVNDYLKKLDHENDYIEDYDALLEDGFQGEPFVYEGFVIKEKKSVDIKPLVKPNEDLSLLSNLPSIIKAARIKRDTKFEYDSYYYTDDRDGEMAVYNPKLARILEEMGAKAKIGLSLAASEWAIKLLRGDSRPERLMKLIEAMWAQIDTNYMKLEKMSPYIYNPKEEKEDEEFSDVQEDEDDDEEYTESQGMIEGLYEILGGAYNYYKCNNINPTDTLHVVLLARNLHKDKTVFDAWMHNVVGRIMRDYPKADAEKKQEEAINQPVISRSYYFSVDTVYNEVDEKEKLKQFVSKLDYTTNEFLPTPETVYLISYVRGELDENPYNKDYSFSKEITACNISILGGGFSRVNNNEMAIQCFDTAEKLDPAESTSYGDRGIHYYRRKEYGQATEYLHKAIAIEARSITYFYLGSCYYYLKEYEKAYESMVKAIEMEESIRVKDQVIYLSGKFVNLAYEAIQKEDYNLAIELSTKALMLNPRNEKAYYNRSMAYLNMGNKYKAKEDMEKYKEANPRISARDYINESITHNREKEYQQAINKATMALQLIKDNKEEEGDAYQEIGYAYGQMSVFDKAYENMNKGIELDPSDPLRYLNAAYYLRALKRFDEAIEYYNKAIEILPVDHTVFTYNNRGKTYAAIGDFDKALADWLVCYNHSSGFTEFIYTILGYACTGNIDKAKELMHESFEKKNNAVNGDALIYYFLQYALQINMENALTRCKELLEEGKTNVDYPLDKLVEVAIDNGHPDAQTLKEVAKRINKTE